MRYCALTLTAELANGDLEYRVGLVVDGDLEEYRVGLVADGDELKNAVLRDDADGRARARGSEG